MRQSFNRLFRCAIIVLRNSTYCAVTILVRTQYFARLQRSYAALPILLSSLLAQKRRSGGRGALVGFSGKVCSILAGGQAHSSHKSPSVRGHGVLCRVSDGSTASDDWLPLSLRWANLFPFLHSPPSTATPPSSPPLHRGHAKARSISQCRRQTMVPRHVWAGAEAEKRSSSQRLDFSHSPGPEVDGRQNGFAHAQLGSSCFSFGPEKCA